jgi:hypothetical protein
MTSKRGTATPDSPCPGEAPTPANRTLRLVTWNCCCGPFAKKVPLLDRLLPDIAVLQECPRPAATSDQRLWFGDNPNKGLLVQAYGDYRLRELPTAPEVPNFVIPVAVSGPTEFNLLAAWTKLQAPYRYVRAAVKAVDLYRELFLAAPTVLMGDLNSNTIWDAEHPAHLNHSALVSQLEELGLVSAYHHHYHEVHGRETRATFHLYRRESHPFHIDYCFIPQAWADRIAAVELGPFEAWRQFSDHRPLLVDLATGGPWPRVASIVAG